MMPYNVSLICLRETKLVVIFDFDVIQMLGTGLDYAYLPTMQIRGGVLVDWHSGSFLPLIRVISQYRFKNGSGDAWWFTGVYCSTGMQIRQSFWRSFILLGKRGQAHGYSPRIST
jgi:hypothetical protein